MKRRPSGTSSATLTRALSLSAVGVPLAAALALSFQSRHDRGVFEEVRRQRDQLRAQAYFLAAGDLAEPKLKSLLPNPSDSIVSALLKEGAVGLYFRRADCPSCTWLDSTLDVSDSSWRRKFVTINLFVDSGSPHSVVVDPSARVRVPGTPTFVFVEDGVVVQAVALGLDRILRLLPAYGVAAPPPEILFTPNSAGSNGVATEDQLAGEEPR